MGGESILPIHFFLPRLILGNAKALFSLCSLGGRKVELGECSEVGPALDPQPQEPFPGFLPILGTALEGALFATLFLCRNCFLPCRGRGQGYTYMAVTSTALAVPLGYVAWIENLIYLNVSVFF